MLKIEPYCAPNAFTPPNYPQAVKVTGAQTLLFIAGQVDYDEKGNPGHPGDFYAQARNAFLSLKAQVEHGGGTMANIVKLNMYMSDLRYRTEMPKIRQEFFNNKWPPAVLLGVTGFSYPGWLIEVDAIAVI